MTASISNHSCSHDGCSDDSWPNRRRWPWVLGGLAVLGLFVVVFQRCDVMGRKASPKALALLTEGYEALLLDTRSGYEAADKAFQSALVVTSKSPLTLAAYGEGELLWAEHLRAGKPPNEAPPAYAVHLRRGRDVIADAAALAPALPAVRRAQSYLERLGSEPDKSVAAQRLTDLRPDDALTLYALAQVAMLPPADESLGREKLVRAVAIEPRMNRARLALARSYLRSPKPNTEAALEQLRAILNHTPEHKEAAALTSALHPSVDGQ